MVSGKKKTELGKVKSQNVPFQNVHSERVYVPSAVRNQTLTLSSKTFSAIRLQLDGCALLAIVSDSKPWVWLACGYVDLQRAETWNHSLGIVTGVDSFEEMLNADVKAVSSRAEKESAEVGMSGRQFLEKIG